MRIYFLDLKVNFGILCFIGNEEQKIKVGRFSALRFFVQQFGRSAFFKTVLPDSSNIYVIL